MLNDRHLFHNHNLKTTSSHKTNWDLLVVGELNMDLILDQVNTLPDLEKEIICSEMNLTIGSSSCIMALNASALGIRTAFSGLVGTDSFGDQCLTALVQRHVDTRHILRKPNIQTGLTVIYTYGNKRGMLTYPGAMAQFSVDDVAESALNASSHLHVSSFYLQPKLRPGLPNLFKKAKELGLTTSLDTNFDPSEQWSDDVLEVLRHTDVFFPNDTEAMAISRKNTVPEALDFLCQYAKLVIVTCGSQGIQGRMGDTLYHSPGLNITVTDTIGAGDTFNSGFLSSFLKDKSIEDSIVKGLQASAFSTKYTGGTTAFNNISNFSRFCTENPVSLQVTKVNASV